MVDDDANVLLGLQRTLRKQFQIETASGGQQALALLDGADSYAVVVADMCMPGMNGVQLLQEFQRRSPDTIRVMLTGNADQQTAVEAVNEGHVFQFLSKPCAPPKIATVLESALRQYRLVTAERQLLEHTLQGAVKVMLDILAINDPESFGRGQVLKDYVRVFMDGRKDGEIWELELAAMLANIGFVGIPPALCQKAREKRHLTGEEKDMLVRVPEIGAGLIEAIPRLANVARIIRYQNKNFDGSGFPRDGVKGDEIPIGARILKVLSDLAELEAVENVAKFQAFEMMQKRSGWYDQGVLEAALARFDVYVPGQSSGGTETKALRCDQLRVGQTLVSNVETVEGTLVVAAGTRVNAALLERLKNWHVLSGVKEPIMVTDSVVPVETA